VYALNPPSHTYSTLDEVVNASMQSRGQTKGLNSEKTEFHVVTCERHANRKLTHEYVFPGCHTLCVTVVHQPISLFAKTGFLSSLGNVLMTNEITVAGPPSSLVDQSTSASLLGRLSACLQPQPSIGCFWCPFQDLTPCGNLSL
jgi:hypothetical protein